MRTRLIAAVAGAAAMLGGCATLVGAPQGSELVGETVRVETAQERASTMTFRRDGMVVARFGEREVAGRWRIEGDWLCFYWTGAPRECWPYADRFRPGVTVPVTSDRGNRVEVTLL